MQKVKEKEKEKSFTGSCFIYKHGIQFLPSQSLNKFRNTNQEPAATESPERNLLAAILMNAVKDLMGIEPGATAKNVKLEALYWFEFEGFRDSYASQLLSPDPFSFAWVCQHLDMIPHLIARPIYRTYRHALEGELGRQDEKSYCDHIDSILSDRLRRH